MTNHTAVVTLTTRLGDALYAAGFHSSAAQRIAADLLFSSEFTDLCAPYLLRLSRASRLATTALTEHVSTGIPFCDALDRALDDCRR